MISKSPSIDVVYTQLSKYILLAQDYTEVPELSFIIKGCRLKPYEFLFVKRVQANRLYYNWVDEYGNSLQINDKKLLITYNDLSIDRNRLVCTDLYYGFSFSNVIKMSKLSYLSIGKDEDLYKESFLLTFLGLDNYLRSYMYLYGEWQQVSPLLLGIKNLQLLAHQTDIKYFKQLKKLNKNLLPCQGKQEWLTMLPVSESFLDVLKNECETLLPYFEEGK